jgi:hypothetical protein
MNRTIIKASERWLPDDERRQMLPVITDQDGTMLLGVALRPVRQPDPARYLPAPSCADMIRTGGTIEHTAGPTWQQRARIAAVLAVGLPVAIAGAWVAARTITALADWAGALLA